MAPIYEAVKVEYRGTAPDDVAIFHGNIDKEWTVGAVPHGGYVLSLILEAGAQYQARFHPDHPDPLHVTANYLQRNNISGYEIRVKAVKLGRSFTNLTAELIQKNEVNVMVHMIFGNLSLAPDEQQKMTIEPPSPFARRIPIYHHPSQPQPTESRKSRSHYDRHVKISPDVVSNDRNKPENKAKMFLEVNSGPHGTLEKLGGGGVESLQWVELVGGETNRIRASYISFLADLMPGFPILGPGGPVSGWLPTLALTIQFFHPIPPASSPDHASRTVGLHVTSNFMVDPHGRHDNNCEVWTAPSNIGEGEVREGWRDKQVCLAYATQLALAMPASLVRRKPKL